MQLTFIIISFFFTFLCYTFIIIALLLIFICHILKIISLFFYFFYQFKLLVIDLYLFDLSLAAIAFDNSVWAIFVMIQPIIYWIKWLSTKLWTFARIAIAIVFLEFFNLHWLIFELAIRSRASNFSIIHHFVLQSC